MPFVTRINQLVNRPGNPTTWWSILVTSWQGKSGAVTLTRTDPGSGGRFAGSIHAIANVNGSEYESIRAKFYSGFRRVIEFPAFVKPFDAYIQIPPWIPQVNVLVEEWREDNELQIGLTEYTDSNFVTISNVSNSSTGVTQLNTTLIYESPEISLKEAMITATAFGTGGGTTANALLALFWNTTRLAFTTRLFQTNLPGSFELNAMLNLPAIETGRFQLRVARLNSSMTFRINSLSSTANTQLFQGHSNTSLRVMRIR